MKKILKYLKNRALEPSTWIHFYQLVIAFGIFHFSPEQSDAVQNLFYALFVNGAVGMAAPDREKKTP